MATRRALTVLFLIASVLIGGCSTPPKRVEQNFWQEEAKKKVAIVINELPAQGALFKEGGQGLLDMAISAVATKGVADHLGTLKADAFLDIRKVMAERLTAQGFEVVQYEPLIKLDTLPETSGDGLFERNLGGIAAATGADRIIVFRLYQFGASRAYYGFIPISAPQGLAAVYGAMVDAKSNRLMWHTGDSLKDAFVKEPVVGKWDEPPAYTNLTAATARAIEKAKRTLVDKFFSS